MNNAAVTVVDTDGVTFASVRHNDVSHLAGLALARPGTRPKFQFSYRLADARRDEAFIRACGEGAWRAVYGSLQLFSSDRFFENARGILEADRRNAFLPLADGRPAGLLLLDSRQDDEAATGHIALVYLLPEYRGMGLGAQLIGRAVIEYRARGMKTLRLNVATVNKPAQRFYERMGFRRDMPLYKLVSRQQVMKLDIHVPCEGQMTQRAAMQLDEILPFWEKLNEAQRALLRGAVHERRFAQGAVIQSTSENCVGLLAIMEGQLRVYTVSDEGRELTLYRLLNGISVFFRDLHYGKPAIRRFDPRAAGYRRAAHPAGRL